MRPRAETCWKFTLNVHLFRHCASFVGLVFDLLRNLCHLLKRVGFPLGWTSVGVFSHRWTVPFVNSRQVFWFRAPVKSLSQGYFRHYVGQVIIWKPLLDINLLHSDKDLFPFMTRLFDKIKYLYKTKEVWFILQASNLKGFSYNLIASSYSLGDRD